MVNPVILILVTSVISFILIFIVNERQKGIVSIISVIINAILSSIVAFHALRGNNFEFVFYGGFVFDLIPIRIDALSGWFILLMNFTVLTSILYGRRYLAHYKNEPAAISLHYFCFLLNHLAMIGIYMVQNSLLFLCVWELMAISAFLLVIFETHKVAILKAGINYLIQSHLCIIFIMLAFIWVKANTGSYDFQAIKQYCIGVNPALSILLFLVFFIGFAFKAGFIPFHTWLPHAHPAAPSHISGLMSGVIIKLGIYGILRMLLTINQNYLIIGNIILIVSVLSGMYGVMLAIVQHNLKKLLAYHSIENIGIIGIGIGLGSIGIGLHNSYLAFAGFAGALLHTLNHSLFKSLLFFASGSVYQATHTLNIESLGGLIKKMPRTAGLFLIAALAICGLPPFNGFISEFLIYSGLFEGLHSETFMLTILFIISLIGLVLIGGMAFLCFTKAFGIIFLGQARSKYPVQCGEPEFSKLFPKYMIVVFIVAIGIFPQIFLNLMAKPVSLLTGGLSAVESYTSMFDVLQSVSIASTCFIGFAFLIYYIKIRVTTGKQIQVFPIWGCGYIGNASRMQYTASSFIRTFRKLVQPILMINKHREIITGIFPQPIHTETHYHDKLEAFFIENPLRHFKRMLGRFHFFQNGSVQFYALYGVVFIFILIVIPFIIDAVTYFAELLKQL